jgi:hypothetical protein
MEFSAMFTFLALDNKRGKYWLRPIAIMGVVEHLGPVFRLYHTQKYIKATLAVSLAASLQCPFGLNCEWDANEQVYDILSCR